MAYRYGDRKQRTLFPQSIDEYIPEDAPVRAYDVIIDALEMADIETFRRINVYAEKEDEK